MNRSLSEMLQAVKDCTLSVDEAVLKLKMKPFEELGYAKVDLHRKVRTGNSEIIYGGAKSAVQIKGIADSLIEHGQKPILITKLDEITFKELTGISNFDLDYRSEARIGIIGEIPQPNCSGRIVIASGGTGDIPVAEEAAITAQFLANPVTRLYDVGVAGLHRLLSHIDDIMSANVIIAVAGMEGALPSVIAGLAECPIIAVPTSVGYGASFEGLAALLSMLNSCANGVSVVNIDNGFGAAYIASMINHKRYKL